MQRVRRFAWIPLASALLALPATAHADDLFSSTLHRYGLVVALAAAFGVGGPAPAAPNRCIESMRSCSLPGFGVWSDR